MAALEERILYEDNHLIILNKEAGELVQGDKTGDQPISEMIKDFIKVRDNKPGNVYLGSPHRLDRPVSGIVIFTKTSKALSRMNDKFRTKDIEKTYWAIVPNLPDPRSGRLEGWMIKNAKQNKSYVSKVEKPGHKHAILNFRLLNSSDNYHILEIDLETGRHHQIRAQLADLGCIIKGDLKYGAPRSNPDGSICLHARSARFEHPVTNELVEVIAPVPADPLWSFFSKAVG